MKDAMTRRYAIYFAPAKDSPWWSFGNHWLGRDDSTGQPLPVPSIDGLSPPDFELHTQTPRRYGFHATLKAPFRLINGAHEDDLWHAVHALASGLRALPLGPLEPRLLGDFVAALPATTPAGLHDLAAQCVLGLDALRAPLADEDLARRQWQHLDARARELTLQYGYPHVLERFRLHFTLSGAVSPGVASVLMNAAQSALARLHAQAPLVLDRLCVFLEPAPGRPFVRLGDVELPT